MIWERGLERGEIDDDLVAVCFRVQLGHESLSQADIESIVDRVIGGVGA